MPSILAIVSRKFFERDFRVGGKPAGIGDVVPTAAYVSTHPTLNKLAAGGDLLLVTVAPGDQLWLAAVLAGPQLAGDCWIAAENTTPITDVTPLIPQLVFENGKGLAAKPGALAMSLQTPRTLTDADAALLRGPVSSRPAPAPTPTPAPEPPRPVPAAVVPAGASAHLATASDRLASGDPVGALDALLARWSTDRAAEVADLIDRLGAHIARALPAIEIGRTRIDAAWREVADQLRPADVPRLLAAFEHGSSGQIGGWLDALARFPLDPRMCPVAIETSVRFVASSAGPTRTRALRLAETIADGRCLPQIDRLLARKADAWNWEELMDRARKMKAKFASPPPLANPDRALAAALADAIDELATRPPPDPASLFRAIESTDDAGSRLLAEVLADPDSDAPRLVYADWLQERGDPRGELIALQLLPTRTSAQDKQIAKLLADKTNVGKWLGPLAAVVRQPVFARGFLSECTVELRTTTHREQLIADPLWSTVSRVRCADPRLIDSPAMRSLRAIAGLDIEQLAALARRDQPVALEVVDDIEVTLETGERGAIVRACWDRLGQVGAFTRLRELSVTADWRVVDELGCEPAVWSWLADTRLARQLARLQIDFRFRTPRLADWVSAYGSGPATLALRCHGANDTVVTASARRDGDRLAMTLDLERPFASTNFWGLDRLARELFDGFRFPGASELSVAVTTRVTRPQRAALEAHLGELFGGQFDRVTLRAAP